jgi:hypothetical protein
MHTTQCRVDSKEGEMILDFGRRFAPRDSQQLPEAFWKVVGLHCAAIEFGKSNARDNYRNADKPGRCSMPGACAISAVPA